MEVLVIRVMMDIEGIEDNLEEGVTVSPITEGRQGRETARTIL